MSGTANLRAATGPGAAKGAASDPACWSAALGSAQLLFGPGSLAKLGGLARDLAGTRVLLVTDPGVRAAGHAGAAIRSLEAASLAYELFDGVEANPTARHVEEGTRLCRRFGADLIVGLGGGSSMDCAKGINFLTTNGGRMEDYWGSGKAAKPMLPSIGIPTTAGTGSEAQSYALIEQDGTRRKMACGDPKARFVAVILDPETTATLPRAVTATSGMDAISHAVESYVCTTANPISRLLAREAWSLLAGGLPTVLEPGGDPAARGRMMLGAHLAGAAIEASMLGAAHACANPLTSRYEIPHGAAVLLMLPHVVRFNEPVAGPSYADLLAAAAPTVPGSLDALLEELRGSAGLPGRLRDCGVPEAELPVLAGEAAQQWTASFNPRPVTEPDLLRLYELAY